MSLQSVNHLDGSKCTFHYDDGEIRFAIFGNPACHESHAFRLFTRREDNLFCTVGLSLVAHFVNCCCALAEMLSVSHQRFLSSFYIVVDYMLVCLAAKN